LHLLEKSDFAPNQGDKKGGKGSLALPLRTCGRGGEWLGGGGARQIHHNTTKKKKKKKTKKVWGEKNAVARWNRSGDKTPDGGFFVSELVPFP